MPSLDRALRPTEFADAWIERQRAALTDAAGKDGRLTRTTAARIATRTDVGAEAADDVVAFFDRTGQKSVSIGRFLDAQRVFIEQSGAAVAGNNGIISLHEARTLPAHLKNDYLAVRGRAGVVVEPQGPPAALKSAIEAAAAGVDNGSESDAPYKFCFAANPAHAPLTAELVRTLFEPQNAALATDIFGPGTSLPSLMGRDFEVVNATDYFAHYNNGVDPNDPVSIANNDKLQNMGRVLQQNLGNLVVVRFGDTMLRPTVPNFHGIKGAISGFVVGQTPNGDLAGVYTGYVET